MGETLDSATHQCAQSSQPPTTAILNVPLLALRHFLRCKNHEEEGTGKRPQCVPINTLDSQAMEPAVHDPGTNRWAAGAREVFAPLLPFEEGTLGTNFGYTYQCLKSLTSCAAMAVCPPHCTTQVTLDGWFQVLQEIQARSLALQPVEPCLLFTSFQDFSIHYSTCTERIPLFNNCPRFGRFFTWARNGSGVPPPLRLCDVLGPCDQSGWTALHYLLWSGTPQKVRLFLDTFAGRVGNLLSDVCGVGPAVHLCLQAVGTGVVDLPAHRCELLQAVLTAARAFLREDRIGCVDFVSRPAYIPVLGRYLSALDMALKTSVAESGAAQVGILLDAGVPLPSHPAPTWRKLGPSRPTWAMLATTTGQAPQTFDPGLLCIAVGLRYGGTGQPTRHTFGWLLKRGTDQVLRALPCELADIVMSFVLTFKSPLPVIPEAGVWRHPWTTTRLRTLQRQVAHYITRSKSEDHSPTQGTI